jgi:peptide/nickel transport system ATP-binding protein
MNGPRIEELTVAYGARDVLSSVTLGIYPGEVVGVFGPSGAGKSTLARALHGQLPQGARIVSGRLCPVERAVYVPQFLSESFSPYLAVGGQILDCWKNGNAMDGRDEMVAMLWSFGFEDPMRIARSYPHELSGGELQRAAWVRALMQRPEFLIADEPTSALDVVVERQVIEWVLQQLHARGVPLLWVSHDVELLKRFATRLVVLGDGVVRMDGGVPDVLAWMGETR